jgi:hypothetical protein
MKVEFESALRDLAMAYFQLTTKDVVVDSQDERKSVT